MKVLSGKVAVVAGASRGAGRGIAVALGDSGATVYVAARTSRSGPKAAGGAPGTVEDTAAEVTARGGCGIPVCADLSDAGHAEALFARVAREQGRLDVLANSAWAGNFMAVWRTPFWELSEALWRGTLATVSAYWRAGVHAARLMRKGGLIVHVTDNLQPDPSAWRGQILHDLGHECINRLVTGMSKGARKRGIAVVGLNPGFMRTETVLMEMTSDAVKRRFRFDLSESPEYIGRAVASLAADPQVLRKSGELLWVADLAREYGFTDMDGRTIPRFDPHAPLQEFPC
ncbi:MAG TPA: SDR family NAD(P)-dependent oxidoreductase [Bryobacteraceae bacterium]|nr:SDR family NAD(P)-dependent oxidoreductase [Bryobacteraceae bacterium]